MAAKERSAPPGGHGPGVAIVIGPAHDAGGRMPPPGSSGAKDPSTGEPKATPEEAGVVLDNEHCVDCANYEMTSGYCHKVDGTYSPQDGCARYFTPASGGGDQEPDADDQPAPANSNTDQS